MTEEYLAATPEFQDWKMDKVYYRTVSATRKAVENSRIADLRAEMKFATIDSVYNSLLAVVDRFEPL